MRTKNLKLKSNRFFQIPEIGLPSAKVKTMDQMAKFNKLPEGDKKEELYSGLHVHIMEHNTEESVFETIEELEKTAYETKRKHKL